MYNKLYRVPGNFSSIKTFYELQNAAILDVLTFKSSDVKLRAINRPSENRKIGVQV